MLANLTLVTNALPAIYKYVDSDGTVYYTDNPHSIPEERRSTAVVMKDLPESIVKKTPAGLGKVLLQIKSFVMSKNSVIILIAVSALLFSVKILSYLWKLNKKKMRLILKKNRPVESKTHSGQLCIGFEHCLYPHSIQKIQRIDNDHLGKTSYFEQKFCRYRQRVSGIGDSANRFSVEAYEKYLSENSFCYHPTEITQTVAWKCYKCNSVVSSERERHC